MNIIVSVGVVEVLNFIPEVKIPHPLTLTLLISLPVVTGSLCCGYGSSHHSR